MTEKENLRQLCYGPEGSQDENTYTFTNRKGQKLFSRHWYDGDETSQARGLVFISHGFSEHLGNYFSLGKALNEQGLLAFGHDHAGHGKSEGIKAYIETVDDYVVDMVDHCGMILEKHGEQLPLFIFGHSMGGMVAVRAALLYPQKFQGMVLVGPLIIPGQSNGPIDLRLTGPRAWIASWALWILDRLVSPELVLGKVDFDLISRDNGIKELLKNDPLRWQGGCKVRLLMAFVECLSENLNQLSTLKVPFISFHGDSDGLCNISGSRLMVELADVEDKGLVEFPGAAHQLLLEVPEVRSKVLTQIVEWIVKRV